MSRETVSAWIRGKFSTRRDVLTAVSSAAAALAWPAAAGAQSSRAPFPQWVAAFRARALARGVSAATYDRVMGSIKPDLSVFEQIRNQPEFNEELWQYLNRRVSDWRIINGRERAKEHADLLGRIEKDFGVEPAVILGLWGVESTFGDPLVRKNQMKPVIPSPTGL